MPDPGQLPASAAAPSPWVRRFAPLIPPGPVLDLAAGAGRHARHLLALGRAVTAVDRNVSDLADLAGAAGLEIVATDLEAAPWPLGERRFAGIVVTNYLHRPLFPAILAALAPGGLLVYETFALGQERFGRPTNPDFLLRPGELLELARGRLTVLAYEDLEVAEPARKRVQRIAARA
jgi:SAM-dependent methyltransferase